MNNLRCSFEIFPQRQISILEILIEKDSIEI